VPIVNGPIKIIGVKLRGFPKIKIN
jgi:hypothetical protein